MVVPPNGGPSSSSSATTTTTTTTTAPRSSAGHGSNTRTAANSAKTSSAPQLRAKPGNVSTPAMLNIPLSARRSEKLDLNSVERRNKPLSGSREPVSRTHNGGILEAPTFRPSEDEWRDPMSYIRSISDVGKRHGIVKIVPPDSWDPDFVIDTERFHFKTRKQELNSVEGGTRANLNYLDQLAKFHKQFGTNLTRFPSVDKRPLDLYELKKAVEARGGFEKVCDRKKWAEIGRALGYSGKIMSSLSTSLKHSYERWLHPYEQWLRGAKPSVQMQLEQERGGPYGTPSPAASPFSPIKKSAPVTPSSLSKESPALKASQALNASINGHDNPSRPPPAQPAPAPPLHNSSPPQTSGFTAVNAGGFTAINARPASGSFAPINSQPQPPTQPNHSPPNKQPEARQESAGFSTKVTFPTFKTENSGGFGQFELNELKRRRSASIENENSSSNRLPKKTKWHENAPTVTGSHMMQHRMGNQNRMLQKDARNDKRAKACETCGQIEDRHTILVCDGCYNSYHPHCLDPPQPEALSLANNWHCPKCLVGTGEFGFEEGGIYSLKQFQTKANDFKENYFKGRTPFDPVLNAPKPVSEDDVEKEFWRLVSSITETVEVEYGADIHSTAHGSGFPTIERNPRNQYSVDPWNLNVLPLHQDSLFRHTKSDISGMTVPWLYVGMCFSTFCWHNEDHYAYSANYQHFGATKTWYGIPGEDAQKFEDAMRKAVPDLFEQQPDLLFQLVTLLEPKELRKAGVRVYAVDQRAGQFVITFPQAYHAGFNHGFNFNEAVNFAPADWEPFGRAGVDRLRDFRRQPCFSHDELLLAASAATGKDLSIKTARWLAPALDAIVEREKARRDVFEGRIANSHYYLVRHEGGETGLQFERQTDSEDLPEDEYVCNYCKAYSYLSRFTHPKTKKISCLDHIDYVDWGTADSEFVLNLHMPTNRLEQIVLRTSEKAGLPEAWVEKFKSTTADVAKPQLRTLRSLLSEGERIPWDIPQLPDLKHFVDRCNEWVEEAISFISRKQQNRRKNEKAWRKGSQAKIAEIEEREKESRKLSKIKKLLAEADRIGFDCQEIATLQEKLDQITVFQHDAQDMIDHLAARQTPVAEVEEMIETGKAFFVDIPQVEHLEKILRQMKWCEKATEPGKSLDEVDELIRQAPTLNVPLHNSQLQYLQDQKKKGELWETKAKELLEVESINYAQLESFSKQAGDLPVSKETLTQIDSVLKKQREAQDMIYSLCRRARSSQLNQRPKYTEIREILESINELNSKPHGTTDLEKLQRRHEDWMRRGKKLFGKTNAPLHILLQHLEVVENRNKYCFDTSEIPKNPVEPSSRDHTPEDDQIEGQSSSPRDVFCLCRKPEDGMMIECKICHEWYHNKCLKIARGKIKEDDDFVCPICDHRVKIPRDAVRPRLEEMEQWQSEIPTLPFQPDEEACLASIINTAQDFRDFISPFANNPMIATMEEVPTLRFYLRKIEGADIHLAQETNFFRQELYRFHPIAPEPPPIIEFSASTRKPRPTKQQKLMKEHGVERPEDLPQHLRTKQYNYKKRNQPDKERSTREGSNSSHHNTPQLQFRPPLTATEFPRKGRQQRAESPLFAGIPDDPYATPAGESGALPPFGSPSTFNATASPSREPNLDPTLFSSDHGLSEFPTDDPADEGPLRSPRAAFDAETSHVTQDGEQDGNLFEGHGSSSQQSQGFDSIFADLTHQEEDSKDDSGVADAEDAAAIAGEDGGMDAALFQD